MDSLTDSNPSSIRPSPQRGGCKASGTKPEECNIMAGPQCSEETRMTFLPVSCCVDCHKFALTTKGHTATGQTTIRLEQDVGKTLQDTSIVGEDRKELRDFRIMLMDINRKKATFDPIIDTKCHCGRVHDRDYDHGPHAHTLPCENCGYFCSNCSNSS